MLDACCLLNLFATRQMEEILNSIPLRFAVVERVVAEALFVRHAGSAQDADEREPVDIQPLLAAKLLDVLAVGSEEEAAMLVYFASQLDDGEAMTCALAVRRGWTVATDDRKALRLLRGHTPPVAVLTTPELMKLWIESRQVDQFVARRALIDIRERARFAPPNDHPLKGWWDSVLGEQ